MMGNNESITVSDQQPTTPMLELMKHCQMLGEELRLANVAALSQIRRLNDVYQRHADFMLEIDAGMKAHDEQTRNT